MIKAWTLDDDGSYKLIIQIPRPLQAELGKTFELEFQLNDRDNRSRKSDFNYALNTQKPITTQVFRREHKSDQWYVHFTTYVQQVPLIHTLKNGCLGLDFNKDSISATYVKPDGNIGNCLEFDFKWQGLTTKQRQALMRDVVSSIVRVAESYQCAIAIESLDFSKKKASMSEESSLYNEMLSNLSTALFRTTLESRCKRYGVELIKVNPAFTSLIGMIKFMAKYGLNSGTSAAMAIARRAMLMSEKLPPCLEKPEDSSKHIWSAWNRIARYIRAYSITRTQLFQWMKALEGILIIQEHKPSLPVNIEMGESKILTIHRELSV
jgi:IS605 OrfB family transposase